jgi:hypothetical protein
VMNYKFRKKPIVIEAFQMTRERRWDGIDWPEWLHEARNRDVDTPGALVTYPKSPLLQIRTLEGVMTVEWDDYIIRGVAGELYPCKPDIFNATYESAL